MPDEVYGELSALKTSQIQQLEKLFLRRISSIELVNQEFATHLTILSSEINRIVACLVDRSGKVKNVMVGDTERVYLPDLGRSRAKTIRFRGLRLIRSSINKSPNELISEDDVTDLVKLQLDAVVSILVGPGGYPGYTHWIHLVPPNPEGITFNERRSRIPADVDLNFESFITELEAEFQRKSEDLNLTDADPAILVHVDLPNGRDTEMELNEMHELCRTANVFIADVVEQRRNGMHPKFGVGRGKLDEIERKALQRGVDLIIFTTELLPRQINAIAETTDLRVIDRTQLILDIFASHATTSDAKTQVELAQLKYNLPRLSSKNSGMSRLTGGIGGRGPGETKLELNRRRANDRIKKLEVKIKNVTSQRELQRARRTSRELPIVAIVGYTNAGKSTLLNRLTDSDVIEENKLFATLRPTSRRMRFPTEKEIIFTDTVGFIHDLPPDLVNAFKATLEELDEADLLLHLVDISMPGFESRIEAVNNILRSLNLAEKEQLLVFNKIDMIEEDKAQLYAQKYDALLISALEKTTALPVMEKLEDLLFAKGVTT